MKIDQITENMSHTAKRIHDIEKEKRVKPGTPEWFKLWFSLPYLKESTVVEGYKLQLERDPNMYVLHILDTRTGKRTEVRGKSGYESGNYDANDKLHQLLDRIGKASNISDLINGEVVGINPKHPDGKNAKAHADTAFNEAKEMKISDLTVSDAGMAIARSAGGGSKTNAPITVTKLPSGHVYVVNGYHRLVDAMNAGKDNIEVEYVPYERAEILWKNEREEDIKYGKQFNKSITEALDNPYPFKFTGPNTENTYFAKSQTPNGELLMEFDGGYDDFSIDFAVANQMGKTNAGDEFRVFATVMAMINKWISVVGIEHVEEFDFAANKDEHASDGRARLYTRFAKKLASQLGWNLYQSSTANNSTEFFSLRNPKPIPRPDGYFDALEAGDLGPNGEIPAQYNENFADGKVKGKSRPGRVKRSGASCNGTVTQLRKRAKNASGEKAKMLRWCANMKSGRQKK